MRILKFDMRIKQFALKTFTTRGQSLTPFELKDNLPFECKRVYWVTKPTENTATGQHCHFGEEEVFVIVVGSATAIIDQGNGKEKIALVTGDAIYVPHHIWHGFEDLSVDVVLLAFSSTNYSADRSDYCEDYEEYISKFRPSLVE